MNVKEVKNEQISMGIEFAKNIREALKESIIGSIYVRFDWENDILFVKVSRRDTTRIWETGRAGIMNYIWEGHSSKEMASDLIAEYRKYIISEHFHN